MDLNDWQNAVYFQLKERSRTVAQLANANAFLRQIGGCMLKAPPE